ncbi:unnamed protein product [Diamesa serratosioi]
MANREVTIALNYHNSCLRLSDIDILKSKEWLNDKLISWYMEYLENDIFNDERFLFIGTEVTQAIKLMEADEVNMMFLEPLKANEREFVFLPVNNHKYADDTGGSHWSLLVYSKAEIKFYSFDSSSNYNHSSCLQLVEKLKTALKCSNAVLEDVETLQQTNHYDCGIYVLANIDNACHTILKSGSMKGVTKISPVKIATKRNEMLEIIRDLGGNIC